MPTPRLFEGQPPLYVQGGLSGCKADLRHALHEVRLYNVIAQGAEMMLVSFIEGLYLSLPFSALSREMLRYKIKIVAKRHWWGDYRGPLCVLIDEMLSHWQADRELRAEEAIDIFENSVISGDFWWVKKHRESQSLYMCTVALLESVNYWCWHEAPLPICFDEKGFRECIQYPIAIYDIDFYQK